MVARHGGAIKTLDELIEILPDRFWSPVPETTGGQMTGLADYIQDLARWIQDQTGKPGMDLVPEVMRSIGLPPSEWYRHLLSVGTEP